MSQSAFTDYGIRGKSNQLVPVNSFSHSLVYLQHFLLFSSLIFLPSQFWDVHFDAFFFLLVSGSYLTPHGFTVDLGVLHFEELAEIQPEGLKPAQNLEQGETAALLDQVGGFGFC